DLIGYALGIEVPTRSNTREPAKGYRLRSDELGVPAGVLGGMLVWDRLDWRPVQVFSVGVIPPSYFSESPLNS
ncbi:MAG TPA: hypothetical protein VFB99_12395, partial [Vicinamibacterales bacterium]|nr:hypothetical protein [Vicinamibacterales bacterium]